MRMIARTCCAGLAGVAISPCWAAEPIAAVPSASELITGWAQDSTSDVDSPTASKSDADRGWYGGFGVLAIFDHETELEVLGVSGTWEGETSWGFRGALGYRFSKMFRLEFEISYANLEYQTVTATSGSDYATVAGDMDLVRWMIGPMFDIEITDKFGAYVGGLIGGAYANGSISGSAQLGLNYYTFSASNSAGAFAYAIRGGVNIELAPQFGLYAGIRWGGTSDLDFGYGITATPTMLSGEFGFTFEF